VIVLCLLLLSVSSIRSYVLYEQRCYLPSSIPWNQVTGKQNVCCRYQYRKKQERCYSPPPQIPPTQTSWSFFNQYFFFLLLFHLCQYYLFIFVKNLLYQILALERDNALGTQVLKSISSLQFPDKNLYKVLRLYELGSPRSWPWDKDWSAWIWVHEYGQVVGEVIQERKDGPSIYSLSDHLPSRATKTYSTNY
jgi:hypothetical protein